MIPLSFRDCEPCVAGAQCERCERRMCELAGPAPQPGCGTVCADCPPCDCTRCWDARIDAEMERAVQVERDQRAEASA